MTTATASRRSLQETTNKLSVGGLTTQLEELLHSKHGLIHLIVKVDLSELLCPVEILLEDAAGDLVELKAVEGLVTELKEPIFVKVSVAGTVNVVVKVLGKKVHVPLKLVELGPVLEIVGDVVHVVLKLVGKVEKELNVVQIVDPVTEKILELITGAL